MGVALYANFVDTRPTHLHEKEYLQTAVKEMLEKKEIDRFLIIFINASRALKDLETFPFFLFFSFSSLCRSKERLCACVCACVYAASHAVHNGKLRSGAV